MVVTGATGFDPARARPAVPEIITFGTSLAEARATAQDALRCHLEGLLKDGEPAPVERGPLGEPVKETVAVSL